MGQNGPGWTPVPAVPLTSCATLSKLLSHQGFSFPSLFLLFLKFLLNYS